MNCILAGFSVFYKNEAPKNNSVDHMDSGIFDEPGCMGKRRGRV